MAVADTFRLAWTPLLKRERGQVLQAIALTFPTGLGSGGELTLTAGSRKVAARKIDLLPYPFGASGGDEAATYLWLVPRPERAVRCQAVWKTPLGQNYKAELTLKPAHPVRVHVIFKTHLDIGYTQPADEVVRLYQTTFMERLLANLDATADRPAGRRFVWTMATWLVEQCLDSNRVKPLHLQQFEHHIRQGNIVWGLTPFTTHSEFFGLEEMCRSLYAARRLAERYGVSVPRAARMTDVPAHTASLAMAFAAAGGTFFQINTNPNSLPPAVPPVFWWKLPDGNRILVHYHGTYRTPLLPPESWPWGEWPAVLITGDNLGPQDLQAIRQMDWLERHFDWPVCRTGRLEDFADALAHRHGRALPVVGKELTDWWIYGVASQARVTASARRDKDRLASAEALGTLGAWASGKGLDGPVRQAVRSGFQNLALYTEHTWGDHASDARTTLPGGNLYTSPLFASEDAKPPVDRWVASWQDKAGFAQAAGECTDRVESQAVAAFAEHLTGSSRTGAGIVLFNTLSWPRGGVVRVSGERLPAGEFELIDTGTGGAVVYERDAGGIEFVAPPVPPCGYLFLELRPATHRARPGCQAGWEERSLTLHTSENTLQFHAAGGMSRWHDRRCSTQWCSDAAEYPTGAYLYEMPGGERVRAFARRVHTNVWEGIEGLFHRPDYARIPQFGPLPAGKSRVHPELTPLYSRIVIEAGIPSRRPPGRRSGDARRCRLTYTLYHHRRELYVNLRLFDKRPTYAAEAGYAVFPFAVEKPYVLVDRIAHLTTPEDDLAAGVNAAHMAVHHGVRVEGDHAGMNFYPLDTPLVSFGSPGAYRFDERGPVANGTIYATLFNNCWGTNFAQWQSGDFSFDFVLHPTGNDGWDGGLSKGGAEHFRPLLAAVVRGRPGEPSASLLALDPAAVQLVALKPADFEPGYCVRLWNSLLDPAEARLTLPASRRGDELWSCDLLERTRRRIPISLGGQARLRLGPHEIATLLLRPV